MKRDEKLAAIVERPVHYLAQCSRRFPQVWRQHDQARREYKPILNWPDWCYAPVAVTAIAILGAPALHASNELIDEQAAIMKCYSALAAWRITKGVYIFDQTIWDRLWETQIEGDLPVEVLRQLPEYCVYIPFPRPLDYYTIDCFHRIPIYGFFAHLEQLSAGDTYLLLTLDIDTSSVRGCDVGAYHELVNITLPLKGDLSECCRLFVGGLKRGLGDRRRMAEAGEIDAEQIPYFLDAEQWVDHQQDLLIRPLLAILLYLCTAEADIRGPDPIRGLRTYKSKRGLRALTPDEPTIREVGYVIGAKFRAAIAAASSRSAGGGGAHGSPMPHVRRAHYHGYWIGPKAAIEGEQPTSRRFILKWLNPIFVNMGEGGESIPTVHQVVA